MRIRMLLAPAGLGAAALMAALAGAPIAVGVGQTVVVADNSFTPATSKVTQGSTVTWSFQGSRTHTSTSNQGFWDSGKRSTGNFPKVMPSSGKFPYHCNIHAEMKGSIVVPLKKRGSAGSGWTLRWSASAAQPGRAFDVQFRRQGESTWRNFRRDTTTASAPFNKPPGSYQLRARTTNTSLGKESGWSPVISLRIS